MDFSWIPVYFSDDTNVAHAMASILQDEEIPICILAQDNPRFHVFGEFEVYVREDHRTQAVAVIEECKINFS